MRMEQSVNEVLKMLQKCYTIKRVNRTKGKYCSPEKASVYAGFWIWVNNANSFFLFFFIECFIVLSYIALILLFYCSPILKNIVFMRV